MRVRTIAVLLVVVVALGGVAVYGVSTGADTGGLQTLWVSDTARPVLGNHHAPTAGRVNGQPVVYAPISGNYSTNQCALVALNATTGEKRWDYQIPAANCTIHSVADPAIADFDGDGTKEVLAETTEDRVYGFNPLTGRKEFVQNLTSYGYTQPIVANVTGGNEREVIAVDVNGTVVVSRPNGTVAWHRQIRGYVGAQPALADFTGDGSSELAVGFGATALAVFENDGTTVWNRSMPADGKTIAWMTTGQADPDPPVEVVVATTDDG